ncbi:glycosyltransferase family 4 protein [Paraburkholderia nemoris]|uniref:glycosyltransferase family 4 protein n=1 Tax=Paraburkholderia nemoris TaxID=2793076 RepID=UPI0038BDECB5
MTKRIVHVTEALGGGVLSFLVELCNQSVLAGYAVSVIYSERVESPENFRELFNPGVKFIRVSMCRAIRPIHDARALIALVSALHSSKPDVIHLHSSKAGVLGRIAARVATPGAKLFYSPHGLSFLRSDVSKLARRLYLTFERCANRLGGTIVACSQGEFEELRNKIGAENARLIENGVDTDRVPKRKDRADGKVMVGMMGRASFQKNHELFQQIAESFSDERVEFVWIGGHEAQLSASRANAIRCTGWVERMAALAAMSELDVYVQTSRWEGMPLALVEAQVAGIPAVVTDVVGNRDVVIHGKTGFVATSRVELREYIEILRSNPSLRNSMGQAAATSAVERFCLDVKFRQWVSLYEDAVASAVTSVNTAREPSNIELASSRREAI